MIKRFQLWYYPLKKIEEEILVLTKEINELPSLKFTFDGIPKRFPSKKEAQEFGTRWSKGLVDSFSAFHNDGNLYNENDPKFNPKDIKGGFLDSVPALFFGMETVSNEDGDENNDVWFWEYSKLKLKWIKEYRNYLKGYTQLQVNWMPF